MLRIRSCRNKKGAVLAEATAGTLVYFCVIGFVVFALLEVCMVVNTLNGLHEGAAEAARELATLYMKNGSGQTPDSAQIASELAKVQVNGVVNNANQFTVTWPTVYAKNAHPPLMVTVVCNAAPNQAGSPKNRATTFGGPISTLGTVFNLSKLSLNSAASYPLRP